MDPGARPDGRRESGGQGFWGVKNGRKRDDAAGGGRPAQAIGALDPDSCELVYIFYEVKPMLRLPLGAPLPIACPDFAPAKPTIHVATLSGKSLSIRQQLKREKHRIFLLVYSTLHGPLNLH